MVEELNYLINFRDLNSAQIMDMYNELKNYSKLYAVGGKHEAAALANSRFELTSTLFRRKVSFKTIHTGG